MTPPTKRPYTIELYGVLPSTVALLGLAIVRNPDLPQSLQGLFLIFLATAVIACTRSVALFIVLLASVLDKTFFNHPLASYIAGFLLSVHLLLTADKAHQPALLRATLLFLGIGLAPHMFPSTIMIVYRVLEVAAVLSFLLVLFTSRSVRLPSNPLTYLLGNPPDNRHRFSLICLSFLCFGSLTWGYIAGQMSHVGAAALIHLTVSVLALPLLLDLLHVDSVTTNEITSLRSHHQILVSEIKNKETLLLELESSAQSIEVYRDQHLKKIDDEMLERQKELNWNLEQRALQENEQLETRRRAAAAELEDNYYTQPWDALMAHLCDKDSVTVPGGPTLSTKDHLLIGTRRAANATGNRIEPTFLHRNILRDHIHVLGGTGAGKTSLALTPIAIQLLRSQTQSPLVFLDLKGERALFHTVREEAERNNRDFLFFSLESGKATYRFNPFVGIKSYGGTRNEQAQPLLDALGLNHGDGYGRTFFTRIHRQRLFEALAYNPNIHSFAQLKEALNAVSGTKPARRPVPVSSQKDELIAAIEGVADYPQLFTTPVEEQAGSGIIQFDEVFNKNQVVYFWLPAPTQSISVREIGKLVLYNLFFSALKRKNAGKQKQAYLLIDEFQRLIGENLALFLEQSRSYGISLTLANQNIEQLNTHDTKLWPLVQSNVRASLHFGSADDKEIDLLSNASGETGGTLSSLAVGKSTGSSQGRSRGTTKGDTVSEADGITRSSGSTLSTSMGLGSPMVTTTGEQHGLSKSRSKGRAISHTESESESESTSLGDSVEKTQTEYLRPSLRPEDIASIFNKPRHFLYWVHRGVAPLIDFDGKPIAAEGIYTMPLHLWERRELAPWPKLPSVPGHVVQTPIEYRTSNTVTENVMVDEFLSVLKESY